MRTILIVYSRNVFQRDMMSRLRSRMQDKDRTLVVHVIPGAFLDPPIMVFNIGALPEAKIDAIKLELKELLQSASA